MSRESASRPMLAARKRRASSFRSDVLHGLHPSRRTLPPKYLYDAEGARLFDEITNLDEYYLTRAELEILHAHVDEVAARLGPRVRVVELGSGSGRKTRLLLERLERPVSYVPIDISREQLDAFAAALASEFPDLEVVPLCADYTRPLKLPAPARMPRRTVAFFPGSTIGNFEPREATRFLRGVRHLCGPDGALLIGVDLHKDSRILELAYDDPHGVTARFNLNLLARIRRECGAELDIDAFRHRAFYDEAARRIVMRLVAGRATRIEVPVSAGRAEVFRFEPGEWITTEHSYKYTGTSFRRLAASGGWRDVACWTDARRRYSLWLLEPISPRAPRAARPDH